MKRTGRKGIETFMNSKGCLTLNTNSRNQSLLTAPVQLHSNILCQYMQSQSCNNVTISLKK